MGNSLSETQAQKLADHFDRVTPMLDGNPPRTRSHPKINSWSTGGRVAVKVIERDFHPRSVGTRAPAARQPPDSIHRRKPERRGPVEAKLEVGQ
jgi:hypothetical protein